jgi:hypothetical protein
MKRLIEETEIDSILSREDNIVPSSGFIEAVIDAVRHEAVTPPPIPFPWKRAVPGLVAGVLALVLMAMGLVKALTRAGSVQAIPQFSAPVAPVVALFHPNLQNVAIWAMLALLAAYISVKLSMRLVTGPA